MSEIISVPSLLLGIVRALPSDNAAYVRLQEDRVEIESAVGEIPLGPWLATFLNASHGDLIVFDNDSDRDVASDAFAEALAAHGIRFFAAARLPKSREEFVCTYGAERRALTGAQQYVLQSLAVTLETRRDLAALRERYEDVVTEKASREERLRLLESVVINANDGVLITEASPIDEPGPRILYANRAFTDMTGYELAEIVGKTPRILQGKDTSLESRKILREALAAWQSCEVELVNYRKDGTPFNVELSIVPVPDETGFYTHWVSVQRDVTDRKAIEAQHLRTRVLEAQHQALAHRAFHDELTGLRNRSYFMDRLGLVMSEIAKGSPYRAAVIFFDLDRFKLVNDSLGHNAGDLLLVEFARRLKKCMRPSDTLARVGGDEFTLLIERIDELETVLRIANRILDELRPPVYLEGQELYANASLGIAFVDARYVNPEDVLRDADSAMYRAKRDGGMRYVCFDDSMSESAVAALALQTDLRRAVERGEFVVYYQPVMDMVDGRIAGVEALVRWNHPERGLVVPGDFIGVAEETGLITAIGEFVLRQSCVDMRRWHGRYPDLVLNVNVSPRQFHDPQFYQLVMRVLLETEFPANLLQLEITESLFLERENDVGEMLAALRRYGVRIALDDFGIGYSSLSYLERFEVDTLKIDRSFVSRLETSAAGVAIVRMIVELARALNLKVVGEGLETPGQVAALRSFACDLGQGFLFGAPADATTLKHMLDNEAVPQRKALR